MRLDRHAFNVMMAVNDLKQKDLVERGIPRGTLCCALNENRISAKTAQRIADALGCKVDLIILKENGVKNINVKIE